jgi:RND family efflux transporter MFP subunit
VKSTVGQRRLRLVVGVILVLTLAGTVGAMYGQRATKRLTERLTESDVQRATPTAPLVSVASVARADLSSALTLAAEFRPFQEVNLYAKVSGYIRQMRVDIGDHVKAGEVLAVLEIPELEDQLQQASAAVERAKQEVTRAKAAYEEAHLTYDRLSEVLKQQPNLVAQQEIDQARARDETLKASWDAAQSAVREAVAHRANYATMLGYSKITAPFTGVVTKRFADTGSLVGAGTAASSQALVRLSQLDPLRLVLPVPESAVPNVREGAPVEVVVQSTKQTLAATVTRVSGAVNSDTRTMQVEVDIPNPSLSLAPGMYATATLVQDSRKNALSLPIEAAPNRKGDTATVYVLDKDHRIQERTIGVGMETATQIEVRSGLEENELVLIGGRRQYQVGQMVQPKLLAQGIAR